MNRPLTPRETSGYQISVHRLAGQVTALRNGKVLATSHRARVMYETRLPPAIYFPREDVVAGLSDRTDLQTFCPFKGTATYQDIILDDETLSNGVWSYEQAWPESKEIEGFVGFMPDCVTEMDIAKNTLKWDVAGNICGPLSDWLLREAALMPCPDTFTKGLVQVLRDSGVKLSRFNVTIWSLHPLIAGKNYVWDKNSDKVVTYAPSYEIHDHPSFVNSPLRHVSNGLGGVRQRLGQPLPDDSFPVLQSLSDEGATDYVAMPLTFSDGRINVLTLTSDHPEGFSTAELGLVFECSSAISRFYEVFMQKENAQTLLETYVGKRSGARVLGGEIRRGDGDEIDAAIMFCDLRNSTRLEEAMTRREYIDHLNRFFECVSDVVDDHDGEVLKFIGDAVLAIFPAAGDPDAACKRALDSARQISAHLEQTGVSNERRCAIGIDFGCVTYGNVGSRERLDFTVIGQAANVAARLCDYGKSRDLDIVVARAALPDRETLTDLGEVQLRNLSHPVHCVGLRTS